MNIRRSSRSCRTLFFLIAAALLLTLGQVPAASAQASQLQVATGYLNAVQGGDASPLVSSHAVLHTPEGSFAGVDGAARFGAKLSESFSNVTLAERSSKTVGEYVIVEFTLTGTHTGAYLDAAPQCAGVSAPGLAVLHVEESGITQQWISYDTGSLLTQIEAFGQIDANSRPTCASLGLVQPAANLAPVDLCLDHDSCSYMP